MGKSRNHKYYQEDDDHEAELEARRQDRERRRQEKTKELHVVDPQRFDIRGKA